MKWIEILNGCLLGDGCILSDRGKYFRFKLTAKDKKISRMGRHDVDALWKNFLY